MRLMAEYTLADQCGSTPGATYWRGNQTKLLQHPNIMSGLTDAQLATIEGLSIGQGTWIRPLRLDVATYSASAHHRRKRSQDDLYLKRIL